VAPPGGPNARHRPLATDAAAPAPPLPIRSHFHLSDGFFDSDQLIHFCISSRAAGAAGSFIGGGGGVGGVGGVGAAALILETIPLNCLSFARRFRALIMQIFSRLDGRNGIDSQPPPATRHPPAH